MAVISSSTNFGNIIKSFLPLVCGIPDSVLNGISPRYIVKISAYKQDDQIKPYLTINAYLQENFTLIAGSTWEGISQMFGGVNDLADTAVQVGTGVLSGAGIGSPRSLVSTVSSHRKWKGSAPVSIRMKLKLEAVSDTYNEVILPSMRLKQLSLPREGKTGGFFLIPPGPSPFSFTSEALFGDTISLNIGNFLVFDRNTCGGIVVDNVSVTFENRMGNVGPIGANIDLEVSTYQMLTQEALAKIYGVNSSQNDVSTPSLGTPSIGQ